MVQPRNLSLLRLQSNLDSLELLHECQICVHCGVVCVRGRFHPFRRKKAHLSSAYPRFSSRLSLILLVARPFCLFGWGVLCNASLLGLFWCLCWEMIVLLEPYLMVFGRAVLSIVAALVGAQLAVAVHVSPRILIHVMLDTTK